MQRINAPPARTLRYAACYNAYKNPKPKIDSNGEITLKQLTFEEKDVARELESAEKYIFN